MTRPLDDLENLLLAQFAGERLTMRAIYERHNVGRPYIKTHYKKALAKMEASGTIMAEPLAEKRRKVKGEVTFAGDVIVAFPRGARK